MFGTGLRVEDLRRAEFEEVVSLFPKGCRLLELGGGNGFQARLFKEAGFDVTSIDLATRTKGELQFPVQDYDGRELPFANNAFDAIFSSNVLEHISDLALTLAEIKRVLTTEGIAVHLMPSPAWRFWTTVTQLAVFVPRVAARARGTSTPNGAATAQSTPSPMRLLRSALGLSPHGEYPNAIAELYYFGLQRWVRVFETNGYRVEAARPSGLFYTGHLLAKHVSIPRRRALAEVLGSACNVYVTRPLSTNADRRQGNCS